MGDGLHLGSSNVITDRSGQFHEHLEYFPYGETWVHEKAAGGAEYMAHLFTGKEYDPETGLYDHGARYRDPKLGDGLQSYKYIVSIHAPARGATTCQDGQSDDT